VLELFHNSG